MEDIYIYSQVLVVAIHERSLPAKCLTTMCRALWQVLGLCDEYKSGLPSRIFQSGGRDRSILKVIHSFVIYYKIRPYLGPI